MKEVLKSDIFIKWLDKLKDVKGKLAISRRIEQLEAGRFGDHKLIVNSNGVYELRLFYGPAYRLYYKEFNNKIIVLLCGGDKDSQDRDKLRAVQIANDYEEEQNG